MITDFAAFPEFSRKCSESPTITFLLPFRQRLHAITGCADRENSPPSLLSMPQQATKQNGARAIIGQGDANTNSHEVVYRVQSPHISVAHLTSLGGHHLGRARNRRIEHICYRPALSTTRPQIICPWPFAHRCQASQSFRCRSLSPTCPRISRGRA